MELICRSFTVDDSAEDAELARQILTACKVKNPLILLRSGKSCMDYFAGVGSYFERELPALVLLDLAMSPMSGIAVLQKLQGARVSKGSVFVMLSGRSDMRTIQKGYQLGAVTFLIKPLDRSDVMQMLDKDQRNPNRVIRRRICSGIGAKEYWRLTSVTKSRPQKARAVLV